MVDGRAEEVAVTYVDGADVDGVVETVETCAELVATVVAALEDFSPFLESASTSLGIGMFRAWRRVRSNLY